MCSVSFYEILIVYKIMRGKYGTAIQTTNDRIIQSRHFAFWIATPINIHLEYVQLIVIPR